MQAAAAAPGNRYQAWQQAEAPAPPVAAMCQQAARLGQIQGGVSSWVLCLMWAMLLTPFHLNVIPLQHVCSEGHT